MKTALPILLVRVGTVRNLHEQGSSVQAAVTYIEETQKKVTTMVSEQRDVITQVCWSKLYPLNNNETVFAILNKR